MFNLLEFQRLCRVMIVRDDLPFSFIESKQFRDVIRYLHPLLEDSLYFEGRTGLRDHIVQDYSTRRTTLAAALASNNTKISFSFDCWSSDDMKPYMAITFHYFDLNWNIKSGFYEFVNLPGSHTGQRLAEAFIESLASNGISSSKQVGGIVADNASNNTSFFTILRNIFDTEASIGQLGCFAHVINLACNEAYRVIEPSMICVL